MTTPLIDERYYGAVPARSLSERLMIRARDNIYDDFQRVMRPQDYENLLDVGASDVVTDAANALERKYPYPERITAAGLGEPGEFHKAFPEVKYLHIEADGRLPFADNNFDIAVSNAVLEHVGGAAHRLFFVRELARVARRLFITVPNRHFPVEHHTAIPLLHYWRPSFTAACRVLKKREWAETANLDLLTQADLAACVPAGRRFRTGYTGLRLGAFSSNLYLVIDG